MNDQSGNGDGRIANPQAKDLSRPEKARRARAKEPAESRSGMLGRVGDDGHSEPSPYDAAMQAESVAGQEMGAEAAEAGGADAKQEPATGRRSASPGSSKQTGTMDPELIEMQRKIDDLGRRIDARERELRQRGVFSNVHADRLRAMKAAHTKLAGKTAEAPRLQWMGMKDELARDYNALVDDLGRIPESLDAAEMKSPKA